LVQAFLKKWWVESDFKAPNLPLSLRLKGSGCHYNLVCSRRISRIIFYQVDLNPKQIQQTFCEEDNRDVYADIQKLPKVNPERDGKKSLNIQKK